MVCFRTTLALAAGIATLGCACSPTTTGSSPTPVLPLRTLRLYETGVGYFERAGDLGSSSASLPVPAGHLDDALKTLVVLSSGGKSTVHGIEFGSSISRGMARAVAGLPIDGDQPLDLQQLLVGLKGAEIEARTRSATYRGRLVDAVVATDDGLVSKDAPVPEQPGDASKPRGKPASLTLLVLTDAGAIVRVPATEVDSVRPLDPTWATRMGSALDALSSRGAQSEQLLHVIASGGPISLGYVAEAPVWRTTYRVVLDDSGKTGVLQGWALLHNDTDENWRDVRVELANGRPDSFLFPLAAPRYTRRPLIAPDDQLATVPQLMGTTVDAIWGDQIGDSDGAGGIGLSGIGVGGGGYGMGSGHGRLGGSVRASGASSSELLEVGNLASSGPAAGVEAGALFVYSLAEHVDLRAHGSTLVPFAQQRVDAATMTWVDSPGAPPRSAVRFANSTSQTLPAGPIAFFADHGFVGESSLARLKPGERRFITYGLDLDVEVQPEATRASEEPKRLVWDKAAGALEEHFFRTTDAAYTIENRSGHPRSVVLAMTLDRNATLTGPDQVDFDAATSRPLAVFVVAAQKRVERKTHAVEGLVRATAFTALTAGRMSEIASAPSLDAADKGAASQAAARLHEAEEDARKATQTKGEIAEVEKDLDRLREHMKALAGERSGGGGGANPFATRVLASEDRLAGLRKQLDALDSDSQSKKDAAQAALAQLVR